MADPTAQGFEDIGATADTPSAFDPALDALLNDEEAAQRRDAMVKLAMIAAAGVGLVVLLSPSRRRR